MALTTGSFPIRAGVPIRQVVALGLHQTVVYAEDGFPYRKKGILLCEVRVDTKQVCL